MTSEADIMEQLIRVLSELDEECFLKIVNDYLGTEYTYDDVEWRYQ